MRFYFPHAGKRKVSPHFEDLIANFVYPSLNLSSQITTGNTRHLHGWYSEYAIVSSGEQFAKSKLGHTYWPMRKESIKASLLWAPNPHLQKRQCSASLQDVLFVVILHLALCFAFPFAYRADVLLSWNSRWCVWGSPVVAHPSIDQMGCLALARWLYSRGFREGHDQSSNWPLGKNGLVFSVIGFWEAILGGKYSTIQS